MDSQSRPSRTFVVVESLVVSAIPPAIIASIFKWGNDQSWGQFFADFGLWLFASFVLFHAIQGAKAALREHPVNR
ncbi:hypothetical protein [Paraburkholderia sp. SIMBA_054]|uniref:hypothetical protein n=1 Tax=Paraburkholderia sp. SIMBA_054 TaxID=3085795 RepID=UPI00397DA76B